MLAYLAKHSGALQPQMGSTLSPNTTNAIKISRLFSSREHTLAFTSSRFPCCSSNESFEICYCACDLFISFLLLRDSRNGPVLF